MSSQFVRFTQFLSILALLSAAGCSSRTWSVDEDEFRGPKAVSESPDPHLVRILPIFTSDGVPAGWKDLLAAADWAEVILVGEEHDDDIGHRVELAIVQDVLKQNPKGTAVSLEMLDRDEQRLVADFMDSIIDAAQFAKFTFSENWSGEGSWENWYQPLIDAAKKAHAPVIAANSPRRYVTLARLEGYDRLRALPEDRRELFDIPTSILTGSYRERFFSLMRDMGSHGEPNHTVDESRIAAGFRSQLLWDATMAQSIVNALRGDVAGVDAMDKVIHFAGDFHIAYTGGTVQEVHRRSPTSRVLTISMQRRGGTAFNEEDRGRADLIIYTGERPAEADVDEVVEDMTPEEAK